MCKGPGAGRVVFFDEFWKTHAMGLGGPGRASRSFTLTHAWPYLTKYLKMKIVWLKKNNHEAIAFFIACFATEVL